MKRFLQHMILLVSLLPVLMFSACDEDLYVDTEPELILEGWIEDGGYPFVTLTRNIPVIQEVQSFDNMYDYVIRWAKISVSDGDTTVILSGKYDPNYFPPYYYTSIYLKGQAGKTYRIEASYNSHNLQAKTTIPAKADIDSFSVEKTSSEQKYLIKAHFKNPSKPVQYYKCFTRTTDQNYPIYLSSLIGCFDGHLLPEQAVVDVHRGMMTAFLNYDAYFSADDTVDVKFCTMDSLSYVFWDDYMKSIAVSRNVFFPYNQNIRSNIEGGFGYWCGYGATYQRIVISDGQ